MDILRKSNSCTASKISTTTTDKPKKSENEYKNDDLISVVEAIKASKNINELKKFQRNVIYALNELLREVESEADKEFQSKQNVSV